MLNNYITIFLKVEHTGSFSVYTLEDFTNTFHNEITKLPVFLNGKQRQGFMLSSINYEVHITIYSSGAIQILGKLKRSKASAPS